MTPDLYGQNCPKRQNLPRRKLLPLYLKDKTAKSAKTPPGGRR